MKTETNFFSETFVLMCQYTREHILEDRYFHQHSNTLNFIMTFVKTAEQGTIGLECPLKLPLYRVSQEERAKLREGVPYVKLYRYNPKHLYPKLNGYGDNAREF